MWPYIINEFQYLKSLSWLFRKVKTLNISADGKSKKNKQSTKSTQKVVLKNENIEETYKSGEMNEKVEEIKKRSEQNEKIASIRKADNTHITSHTFLNDKYSPTT